MADHDNGAPRNSARRDMLKRVGLASAAAVVPATAPVQSAQAPFKPAPEPVREALEALTGAQADILEAACARIVPSDASGPGAAEARAAHYIARALAGPLASAKTAYVSGLAALDACAQATRGAPFAKLAPAAQDAILTEFEKNAAKAFHPNPAGFFATLREHTMQGMFSDPYYGGNRDFIGWDLLGYPGIRMVASADDQSMSKPPEKLRRSAYDEPMFGKHPSGGGHGH